MRGIENGLNLSNWIYEDAVYWITEICRSSRWVGGRTGDKFYTHCLKDHIGFQMEIWRWHLDNSSAYCPWWYWGLNGLYHLALPPSPVISANPSYHPPSTPHDKHFLLSPVSYLGICSLSLLTHSLPSIGNKKWEFLTLDLSSSSLLVCCVCSVASIMSNSLWPHGLQPTRLLYPWDSPGKDTGVGCHALLQRSSWLRDRTHISCLSCIAGGFFTTEPTREAPP